MDNGQSNQAAKLALIHAHLDSGVPLASAARDAGVPIRTARRWLARFRDAGRPGSRPSRDRTLANGRSRASWSS